MGTQQREGDVFYDQGNGEFQLLSAEDISIMTSMIAETLQSCEGMSYDTHSMTDSSTLTERSTAYLDVEMNLNGEFAPKEIKLTVHTIRQKNQPLKEVTTITILEQVSIGQMTTLHHDYQDLYTLTENYITGPFYERYVIYTHADNRQEAQVEQYDMMTRQADLCKRPMTLYDAYQLVAKIDEAVEKAAW